jgi:DNA-binding MarR family transcriptional regulator
MTSEHAPRPTGPDGRWAHQLGHLLWEVSAQASVLGEAEFAGTVLTGPSLGLLRQIGEEPGVTIAEISRRLPTTQQAISQVVARLEKLGYVERRLGPRRGVGLHLTQAGIGARDEGGRLEEAFEHHLRDRLGGDDYAQLCTLLERARDQLKPHVATLRSAKSQR